MYRHVRGSYRNGRTLASPTASPDQSGHKKRGPVEEKSWPFTAASFSQNGNLVLATAHVTWLGSVVRPKVRELAFVYQY
jgi:hypothetical protein